MSPAIAAMKALTESLRMDDSTTLQEFIGINIIFFPYHIKAHVIACKYDSCEGQDHDMTKMHSLDQFLCTCISTH